MKTLFLTPILTCLSFCSVLAAQLDGGSHYSLAVKEDGTVWAWGAGGLQGDGTLNNRSTAGQVSNLTDVISVSAAAAHALALKRDGTVWAWGWNEYGQLGDGTDEAHYTPVQVAGLSGVIDISAGYYYSLALKNDGTVWAWGVNDKGQLGDGTTSERWTPVQVAGLSDEVAVSAGHRHSMALKRDGTIWAWGQNTYGQLGDGTTSDRWSSVQASNLTDVISISAGLSHSLALKHDGTVWAWGKNSNGELGDGRGGENYITNMSLTPVQTLVYGVIDIQTGGGFSLALTSYGTVWFWGNLWLELLSRHPESIKEMIPVPVDSDVKAIAAGADHVLSLKNDGTVWAWGDNGVGDLGDGTTEDRRYPVQVKDFSTGGSASVPSTVLAADFDEDGKADPVAVSDAGDLFYWNSSQSFSRTGPIELGLNGAIVVDNGNAPDVDDAPPDMAVVKPGGLWIFFLSGSNGYSLHTETFGQTGTPLLADFDGDRKADPVIVNSSPSTGSASSQQAGSGQVANWYFWLSADNYSSVSAPFTVSGATPVAADFDGDGKADPVMVTTSGDWYLWPSDSMYIKHGPYNFGVSGKPVAGDFDGDRRADPCIVDSTGNWNLFLSSRFYTRSGPWYLVLP